MLAALAAGLSVLAHRFDQLWVAVAGMSFVFAGGGLLLHFRGGAILRELDVLREHLEATRQHAGLLARHTRELRETFLHAGGNGEETPVHPADFATLSALVRDLADGVAELDRRSEAVEAEIAELHRTRGAAQRAAAPGWLAAGKASHAPAMPRSAPARPGFGAAAAGEAELPELGGAGRAAGAGFRDSGLHASQIPPAEPYRPQAGQGPASQGSAEFAARMPPPAPRMPAMPEPERPREPIEAPPAAPEPRAVHEVPLAPRMPAANEPPRAVRQLVAAAIAADRFDLFLQRVVGLPQRRTRGYDVSLRPDGSDVAIPNTDIRQAVEAVGNQLTFDRKLMIQAVRLARVFEQRERDVFLFTDISQRFLMSEAAFDELDALVADVPAAPRRIVLCLPQRFFKKAVAFEHEALRTLGKMGFSFAMRDVEDLDIDPARLEQSGVRWIRMPANRFLAVAQENETLLDVATTDFVALLARRRVNFIADQVTDEREIAELLDLNVEFGHGLAFAPPQAVRSDVLDPPSQTDPPRPPEPAPERRSLRDLARRA